MAKALSPLEQDLAADLERIYREAGKRGYWAHRYRQKLERDHDPVKSCRDLIRRTTAGFKTLEEGGDLDLSVERLILRPKYANLFSIEERELAFKRLQDAGTG
jgi:hypothetical protein